MPVQSSTSSGASVFEIVTARMFSKPPRTLHPEEITPALVDAQHQRLAELERALGLESGRNAGKEWTKADKADKADTADRADRAQTYAAQQQAAPLAQPGRVVDVFA